MEAEIVCSRGVDFDHGGGHVPALAYQAEDWGVVFEYGCVGFDRLVLRDGDLPVDLVRSDVFCRATGTMAVSKSF